MKNYTGQVEGFERIGAAQRKRDEEAAVLAWLREQGDDGKPALEAHDKLVALATDRSEEHTSELQSLMRISYAVFCLKKKNAHTYPVMIRDNNTTLDHVHHYHTTGPHT